MAPTFIVSSSLTYRREGADYSRSAAKSEGARTTAGEGRAISAHATFVAVAGSIGAGKSSLIGFLQRRFGLHPYYERNEENPFLEDFYRDMRAYAFPAQAWFLARMPIEESWHLSGGTRRAGAFGVPAMVWTVPAPGRASSASASPRAVAAIQHRRAGSPQNTH